MLEGPTPGTYVWVFTSVCDLGRQFTPESNHLCHWKKKMVDFKKRLARKDIPKPIDPLAIYDNLDRASDKGPLRPAQMAILNEWHERRRDERDIIVKLHTGQGKTLVGLLLLQSKLNEEGGRVV